MLIFEQSQAGRSGLNVKPVAIPATDLPSDALRTSKIGLPDVSELQVVRHYTRLSQKNFSIDTQFYPLGSCTMKYNPKVCHTLANLPEFASAHPLADASFHQGWMACLYDLQQILKTVTGMDGISLTPAAGAQGEFAGVAMIKAYHQARGEGEQRNEILVPDAAHGTNPASAVMCGFKVKEIPSNADGDVDLEQLQHSLSDKTAGIMLTNPSTLGVFERQITEISAMVHQVGGLLYYDGANLNAILAKVRPREMGFDIVHINLHKTFSTPHGGGGPGAGPVGVVKALMPFLPVPMVDYNGEEYTWITEQQHPQTIGRLTTFAGNSGILLRAYIYARLLGGEGMTRVAEFSCLNANYLMVKLQQAGFDLAFPERRASHECIVTLKRQAKEFGVHTIDFAKRLLDYNYHAPTTYFPLLVPECLLIEPTETETKQEIDGFINALITINNEAKQQPKIVKNAPYHLPVKRLDEVKAARELDIVWTIKNS